eukprot:704915-Pyramimonas_sp.AAC.1
MPRKSDVAHMERLGLKLVSLWDISERSGRPVLQRRMLLRLLPPMPRGAGARAEDAGDTEARAEEKDKTNH